MKSACKHTKKGKESIWRDHLERVAERKKDEVSERTNKEIHEKHQQSGTITSGKKRKKNHRQ